MEAALQPKLRYLTRDEVVVHNSHDDMWVIVNGRVFDVTSLYEKEEPMSDVSRRCIN
jgi:cytochrome b involved in lipid metabolism